jgi:hypothetical protein
VSPSPICAAAVEVDPGAGFSSSLDTCATAVEWLAAVHEVDSAKVWESDEVAVSVACRAERPQRVT